MHRSTLVLVAILFVPLAAGAFFSSELSSGFKTAFTAGGIDRSMLTANATHSQEKGRGDKGKPEKKEKKNKNAGSETTDGVSDDAGDTSGDADVGVETETVSQNTAWTAPAFVPVHTNTIILVPTTAAPLPAENAVAEQQPASQTPITSSAVSAVNTASADMSASTAGSGSPVSGIFSAIAELFSPAIKAEHALDASVARESTAVSVKTKPRTATAPAGRAESGEAVEQPTAGGEVTIESIDNSFMAQVSNEHIFAMIQNAGRSVAEFWNTKVRTAFRSVRELLASVAHSMTAAVSFGE